MRTTKSGYKGVTWSNEKKVWVARIQVAGVRIHLGTFQSSIWAGIAYDQAARICYGKCAYLNFPWLYYKQDEKCS